MNLNPLAVNAIVEPRAADLGDYSAVLDAAGRGNLVVDQGSLILVADYQKSGSDLILTGPDGVKVLILNYFESSTSPDLWTAGGARVASETAAKLAGVHDLVQYAQAGGADSAAVQPIGVAEAVRGDVLAVRADGTRVVLRDGSPVFQGDVIETGANSSIGLRFNDDTSFAMQGNGRMVLDELIYDPGTQSGSAAVSVLQGAFVFVTGQVAKTDPSSFSVSTPLATIGVRGTMVGGTQDDRLDIYFNEGAGFIQNAGGRVDIDAGERTFVLGFNLIPQTPQATPPGLFDSLFQSALGVLPATQFYTPGQRGSVDEPTDEEAQAAADVAPEAGEGSIPVVDVTLSQELVPQLPTLINLAPLPPGLQAGLGRRGSGRRSDNDDDVVFAALNQAPFAIELSSVVLSEGAVVGSVVGLLSAIDPDDGEFTFSIVDDPDGRFEIVGNELRLMAPVDFETQQVHEVVVRATDSEGLSVNRSFTISVSDLPDTVIFGTPGDDVLVGGPGADLFIASPGNDVLDGLGGADTVDYSDSDTGITADLTTGNVTGGFGATDTLNSIENVTGTGQADVLIGDAGDNILQGGAGDDTLNGGAGNDTLLGGDGDDKIIGGHGEGDDNIDGGTGNDTVSYTSAVAGIVVNLETGVAFGDPAIGVDSLNAVENVIGGQANDLLVGNAAANRFEGGMGDDVVLGGAGDDEIFGGDIRTREPVALARPGDVFDISNTDQANLRIDFVSEGAGFENTFGFYLADADGVPMSGRIVFANVDVAETASINLDATVLAGASQLGFFVIPDGFGLNGGLLDSAEVGFELVNGFWTVTLGGEALEGNGAPALFSDPTLNADGFDHEIDGGESGNSNWEDLAGGGDGDFDDLKLDIAVREIPDEDGDDTLSGGDGDDQIFGGSGDDVLTGDVGDDRLSGGRGNDQIDGGAGNFDVVLYDDFDGTMGVDVDLVAGTARDVHGDTDQLSNVEGVVGSRFDDRIAGDAANNLIIGGGGDDVIAGGAGSDVMVGDEGADLFSYLSLADGTDIAGNTTVGSVSTDLVEDFESGVDKFVFDAAEFDPGATFVTIGSAYNGNNSGVESGAAFVYDGTHLIYDEDVSAEGYTVVADTNGKTVTSDDIDSSNSSGS